jgi:hypothetical protein
MLNTLSPNSRLWAWTIISLSIEPSLTASTSRAPCGDVTTTNGGTSRFGPSDTRATGAPASRILTAPVLNVRTAVTRSRNDNGTIGAGEWASTG